MSRERHADNPGLQLGMIQPERLTSLPQLFPEIICILFRPAGLRGHIGLNMPLGFGDQLTGLIKQHGSGALGTLIQSQ